MELVIKLSEQMKRDLQYAVIELDIVTCTEGQCTQEPDHWTPEEVVTIVLEDYLNRLRTDISLRPVPDSIWKHILPRTGRDAPPQRVRECPAVVAMRQEKKVKARR